jgi:hypothetical protein
LGLFVSKFPVGFHNVIPSVFHVEFVYFPSRSSIINAALAVALALAISSPISHQTLAPALRELMRESLVVRDFLLDSVFIDQITRRFSPQLDHSLFGELLGIFIVHFCCLVLKFWSLYYITNFEGDLAPKKMKYFKLFFAELLDAPRGDSILPSDDLNMLAMPGYILMGDLQRLGDLPYTESCPALAQNYSFLRWEFRYEQTE